MSARLPFASEPALVRKEDDRPMKVGFCVSGKGRLFREAAEHAEDIGILPTFLLLDLRASRDLEHFARDRGIAIQRLAAQRRPDLDRELSAAFESTDSELWALTFDKILPPSVVESRRGRIINVHMALLPAFAGMHGIRQTLEGGARFGGATIHEVDRYVDHGPIIAQCAVGLLPDDDDTEVGRRIWPLLRATYLQVLAWYAAGRVRRDASNRLWVDGASYGKWPISPSPESPHSVHGVG